MKSVCGTTQRTKTKTEEKKNTLKKKTKKKKKKNKKMTRSTRRYCLFLVFCALFDPNEHCQLCWGGYAAFS